MVLAPNTILKQVKMENFYDGLRINIRSILSPVSEETVIGIIQVIQNAGFETLSDLQFLQENDFMSVLKPIARRKLIKMWSNPDVIEQLKCEYERKKNEGMSREIDLFLAEAKISSESITSSVMMESITELLKENICRILNSVSEETLDDIINALKCAGLQLLLDLKFVREDDLTQVLNPIQRRKLVKAWSQQSILLLFSNASIALHEPAAADHNDHEDTSSVSSLSLNNVSSSIHSLNMPIQRHPSPLGSSSGVSGLNYKFYGPWLNEPLPGVPDLIDQDSLQHEPPSGVYDLIDQDPLPPGPSGVFDLVDQDPLPPGPSPEVPDLTDQNSLPPVPLPEIPDLTDQDTFPPGSPPEVSNFTDQDSLPSAPFPGISDITDQDSLSPALLPGVNDVTDQDSLPSAALPGIPDITEQNLFSPGPPPRVPHLTDQDPLSHEYPSRVSSFISNDKRIPSVKSSNLPPEKCKWNRSKHHQLLQVCAKYKKELYCAGIKKNHKIWRKIAEEVSQKFNSLRCHKDHKTRLLITESECMDQIKMLRGKYHLQKNAWYKKMLGRKMIKLFNTARKFFEPTENSATFAESSSNVSMPSFKWLWNKRLALLRLYAIFKTELSSSIINKQSVWKKIAEKVGKSESRNCDSIECQSQIKSMKFEYEEMKYRRPYELNHLQAVFFDEAENAFENIENPVVLSLQSDLEKWTMSKPERIKLIQVYSKYKAELSLENFDVENQIVWGKVSREISKKCSSFYGKRRCFYEINHLKRLYESYEKKNLRFRRKPYYFFDEAKKAFESTECSDTYMQKAKKSYCDNRARRNHTHLKTEVQDVQRIVVQNADAVLQRGVSLSDQHEEVNSSKDLTVKQKRRNWYEHINI